MSRNHARIQTAIWADPDFRALTITAQWLYMLLLSQPRITLCGVQDFSPGRWAGLAANANQDDIVIAALAELHIARYIVIDAGHGEILIRTFLEHDGAMRWPKTMEAARNSFAAIVSPTIRQALLERFPELFDDAPLARAGAPERPHAGAPTRPGPGAIAPTDRRAQAPPSAHGQAPPIAPDAPAGVDLDLDHDHDRALKGKGQGQELAAAPLPLDGSRSAAETEDHDQDPDTRPEADHFLEPDPEGLQRLSQLYDQLWEQPPPAHPDILAEMQSPEAQAKREASLRWLAEHPAEKPPTQLRRLEKR